MREIQAKGQLVTAVSAGGENTLLKLAEKTGPVGDLARKALDKMTEPNSRLSALEAVESVF